MTQHRVKDEHGVSWIIGEGDAAAQLWERVGGLPPNDIVVPRRFIAPELAVASPPIGNALFTMSPTDVMKDGLMMQMVVEQIYRTLNAIQ